MKPFNLAELRIAERNFYRQCLNRRLQFMMLFVLLTLCVAAVSYACKLTFINKVTNVRSSLADVQHRHAQVSREISAVNTIAGVCKWQDQLASGTEHWIGILHSITNCMSAEVWLSRFETSQKDATIILEGRSSSFQALSEFISGMRRNSRFTEVRLVGTKISKLGGLPVVDFSLHLKLGTQPAAPTAQAPQGGDVPTVQETP